MKNVEHDPPNWVYFCGYWKPDDKTHEGRIWRRDMYAGTIEDLGISQDVILTPFALAADTQNKLLFWTDIDKGLFRTALFANWDGAKTRITLPDAGNPTHLAVDPGGRRIFFSRPRGGSGNYSIEVVGYDGSGHRVLAEDRDEPTALTFDYEHSGRLHWMTSHKSRADKRNHLEWLEPGNSPDGRALPDTGPRQITGGCVAPGGRSLYVTYHGWVKVLDLTRGRTKFERITKANVHTAFGMALDPQKQRLYWANEAGWVDSIRTDATVQRPIVVMPKHALFGVAPVWIGELDRA